MAAGPGSAHRPRILAYHAIDDPSWTVNNCSLARFERHLDLLEESGYGVIDLDGVRRAEPSDRVVAITFDDGLRSVARLAGPVLAARRLPWTIFVVSGWADRAAIEPQRGVLGWDELRRLDPALVTVGAHSHTHPDFGTWGDEQVRNDLATCAERFTVELGAVPAHFAVPLGTSRNWRPSANDLAHEVGFRHVYAQAEDTRTPGTIGRSFVVHSDDDTRFLALLRGAFDQWEEPPL